MEIQSSTKECTRVYVTDANISNRSMNLLYQVSGSSSCEPLIGSSSRKCVKSVAKYLLVDCCLAFSELAL